MGVAPLAVAKFAEPIDLPAARLRGAAAYIATLPKAEHSAPEWQAAMTTLILVAEKGGDPMLPRIA